MDEQDNMRLQNVKDWLLLVQIALAGIEGSVATLSNPNGRAKDKEKEVTTLRKLTRYLQGYACAIDNSASFWECGNSPEGLEWLTEGMFEQEALSKAKQRKQKEANNA